MSMSTLQRDAAIVAQAARRISSAVDYDALIERAGEAQLVLIGEASHGTHEFYATRAELTKRLIDEKGFRAVALEADWPDSFRVHRFVTGRSEDASAAEALSDFQRFPAWMWRNTVVVEFIEWLHAWNGRPGAEKGLVGIYGLDLYSMHTSIESVLGYLDKMDPHERGARDIVTHASSTSAKSRKLMVPRLLAFFRAVVDRCWEFRPVGKKRGRERRG